MGDISIGAAHDAGKRPVRVTLFLLRLVRTLSGRHNGSGDAHFPRSAISSQVMVSPAACFDPLEALEKGPLEKSTCFASRGYDVGMENGAETRLESISAQRPRADGRRVAVMEIHGRRRLGSAGLVRFATREGGVFEGQADRPADQAPCRSLCAVFPQATLPHCSGRGMGVGLWHDMT
jgi:hypothetical protein